MVHIATLYTHAVGRQHPNLIHYFWDQSSLTLLQQREWLIDGILCPETAVDMDPDTKVWCKEEALMLVAGTSESGQHYRDDGTLVVVY